MRWTKKAIIREFARRDPARELGLNPGQSPEALAFLALNIETDGASTERFRRDNNIPA